LPVNLPLVGRREELDLIEHSLSRSDLAGVVLAGEAGVGKTRLAREAIALAERKGLPAVWGSATQAGQSVPFGALAHLLPPSPPRAFTKEDLIRAAADALTGRFEDRKGVLGVDDAHLLDEHSAVLLLNLAQGGRVFLVAAVRSGEETPDPITALWKDDLCDRLEIQALSEAEVGVLLEEALGGQVESVTAHRLWEVTRGNPLYLRELFLGGLESGALREAEGFWRWHGALAQSPRLREVIDKRLGRLTPDEREILETVAAAEPLGARLLETLADREIVASLEESLLLIEEIQDKRVFVRLGHPLYAEAIRSRTPPARARALIGRLAEALEGSGARRREDVLRLATWNLEAGRPAGPDAFIPAASQALALLDYSLAERLATAASEGGGGTPSSFLLAQALMGQGRFDEAEALLARLDREAGSEAERTQAISARAHNLFWNMGERERCLEILEQAETALRDPNLRNELSAARGYLLFVALGRAAESIPLGRAVLESEDATDGGILNAVGATGQALQFAGRPEEAFEIWARLSPAVLRALEGLPIGPVAPIVFPFWGHWFAGRFEEAGTLAEDAHRGALEGEADWVAGFFACLAGISARSRGRVATSARWGREGTARLRPSDILGQLGLFLADLSHSLALLGDVVGAEAALEEAAQLPSHAVADANLEIARVWIAAARGELSSARVIAREAAQKQGALGLSSLEAILLHDVARLGEPATVVAGLGRISEGSDSRLMKAFAVHARALADSDAQALDEVSGEFEDMGAMLLAAECAAEASRAFKDAGRTGSSLAAAERARALAATCEGARTPALAEASTAVPLTAREREIGLLAARGHSNREIAGRLVLSPRTVGNHLHNLYAKLGVEGREELGPILEPAGGTEPFPRPN
jgi:ATP/maltotriose-dependent transcriptional regulator MalT